MLSRLICRLWGHKYNGVILSTRDTYQGKTVTKILCQRCAKPVTLVYYKHRTTDRMD